MTDVGPMDDRHSANEFLAALVRGERRSEMTRVGILLIVTRFTGGEEVRPVLGPVGRAL